MAWNSGQGYGESKAYVASILNGQNPSAPTQGIQQPQGTSQNAQGQQSQPQAKKTSALSQIMKMGGVYKDNNINSSILSPNLLTTALANSYDTNTPPPPAQTNPMSLFSNIFTGQG